MLNKVCIMGRLVRDPELRRTQSGVAVTTMRIAVDRDFKAQDGSKQADFFDVVAWRNTAEFVSRYFSKGRMMVVEGSLQTREWTDRDNNKRVNTEIVADRIYFGDSKRDGDGSGAYGGYASGGYGSGGYGGGYGAPSGGYGGGNYGAPSGGYGGGNYGAPSGGYGGGNYGAPSGGYGGGNYGAPSGGYGGGNYGAPSGGYGAEESSATPAAPASDNPPADNAPYPDSTAADSTAPSGFAEMSDDDGDLPF